MPLVSVIIATFRRPDALKRAMASSLAQTVADLEVVVVVERSDELSVAAVEEIGDPRVRLVVNPVRNGPGVARDFGAQSSSAVWLAFLDDDDEWSPDKLERQFAAVSDSGRRICTTLSRVVTDHGVFVRPTDPYEGQAPIDEWLFDRRFWLKSGASMLQTSSLLVPRALFDTLSFGKVRHEEWELVIRAVKEHGYDLVTVREPLVTYYAGNLYPWRPSADWIDSVRELVSPRAYSGFCLTVATQGLTGPERNKACLTFLTQAFRHGRPTIRQLFAFGMIWLLPDGLRSRLRGGLGRRGTR